MDFHGIEDISGDIVNISNSSELQEGDRIINIDGTEIVEIQDLREMIEKSNGNQMNMRVIGVNRIGKAGSGYTNKYR